MASILRAISVILLLAAPGAVLGQPDTEPPVLVDFDFNPKSIDTSEEPATVTCTMSFDDSPAGVDRATCQFSYTPPGGGLSKHRVCYSYNPAQGDVYSGTWECGVVFEQYINEGTWTVTEVHGWDEAGNYVQHTTNDLQQAGFPTELQVTGNEDIDAPSLVDFDFNPKSIDTSEEPATVTCTMSFDDSPAGVDRATCQFSYTPPGGGLSKHRVCYSYNPAQGDVYSGTWECGVVFEQYINEGTWTVTEVHGWDEAGNYVQHTTNDLQQAGFPTELQVTGNEDIDAPSLVDFDFNPKSIDTSEEPATVTCTMSFDDSPAGVDRATCQFSYTPPGGGLSKHRVCYSYNPAQGDVYSGTWECGVVFEQYINEGTWTVTEVHGWDEAGNYVQHTTNDLQQAGFPTQLLNGFVAGTPTSRIVSPLDEKSVRGNSVTIVARLTSGNPSEVSPSLGVRFDYRPLSLGDFTLIPARNPNHPNPDTTYPYFIHWDVSGVAEGDYELRAVAHDLEGNPDPAPETIMITIDHGGPVDVDENENAGGLQESRTAVDDAVESEAGSGDHTEASTATEFIVPAGALTYATDTTVMTHLDPATEIPLLEQPEQDLGSYVDVVLESGQTAFEGDATSDLNISYSDRDQDGVVDGTNVREDEIELRYYDDVSGTYLRASGWIVMTEHNMVHADIATTGRYALAGPLQPRVQFDVDKQSLTWGLVAEATSYNVYRGALADLIDTDQDGLPDGGYGDCMNHLDPDTTDGVFVDDEPPAGAGAGFFYVVSYVGPTDESTLGNSSAGLRREVVAGCP